jgi:hypothetical protein
MNTELIEGVANYTFSANSINVSALVGRDISIKFQGKINCIHCNKITKKSYSGGYCYPCSIKLAECDLCILRPHTCHFQKGTCRDEEFAKSHCFKDHIVYVAASSGVKVGITRLNQIPTRFIDQGASFALPIFKVKSRYHSGLIELLLSETMSDKTDWRKMLRGEVSDFNLENIRREIFSEFSQFLDELEEKHADLSIEYLENENTIAINYPVLEYPTKINSTNFDKTNEVRGKLMGIKGQYLIFKDTVLNIRNHTGYNISLEIL